MDMDVDMDMDAAHQPEPSASPVTRKRKGPQEDSSSDEATSSKRPQISIACDACTEVFNPADIFQAYCGHNYCVGCMTRVAEMSLAAHDARPFPPRCCNVPFPQNEIRMRLPSGVSQRVLRRLVEDATKNYGMYCCNPYCSAFFKSNGEFPFYTVECPFCRTMTCIFCRSESHVPSTCARDDDYVLARKLVFDLKN
ncbi:IBR finger domain-containing protein [Colletotrichum plurivorum]|uniref:RBR-type E3 ubiquitin transferase n=1 Tax=Colletotrichum plurivorum TaxID=2175906 RepID=A0A8H6K855_9PEZI|nr:IBR finger domain-containing protein [Colletotrichum plurivorum]